MAVGNPYELFTTGTVCRRIEFRTMRCVTTTRRPPVAPLTSCRVTVVVRAGAAAAEPAAAEPAAARRAAVRGAAVALGTDVSLGMANAGKLASATLSEGSAMAAAGGSTIALTEATIAPE